MNSPKISIELTPLNIEMIRRFAVKDKSDGDMKQSLEWLASGLTQVKTETAFQLARGGRDVMMLYADGTDSLLDDIDAESEYYPDKSKSWPQIETIFLVEGEL